MHVHGKENLKTDPCVYALWHGESVMMPWLYVNKFPPEKYCSVIVSKHGDGGIASAITESIGVVSLRGSSNKGGAKALKAALSFVKKGGSVIITPDGPRGPYHSVADGVVAIAQMAKIPIIPVSCKASSAWQLKSWDKMFIPKPFSKIEFYIGNPLDISNLSKEEAKEQIKARMVSHAF